MFEGSASVALLVVNKLPALQALALDYADYMDYVATEEQEEPSPACVRSQIPTQYTLRQAIETNHKIMTPPPLPLL